MLRKGVSSSSKSLLRLCSIRNVVINQVHLTKFSTSSEAYERNVELLIEKEKLINRLKTFDDSPQVDEASKIFAQFDSKNIRDVSEIVYPLIRKWVDKSLVGENAPKWLYYVTKIGFVPSNVDHNRLYSDLLAIVGKKSFQTMNHDSLILFLKGLQGFESVNVDLSSQNGDLVLKTLNSHSWKNITLSDLHALCTQLAQLNFDWNKIDKKVQQRLLLYLIEFDPFDHKRRIEIAQTFSALGAMKFDVTADLLTEKLVFDAFRDLLKESGADRSLSVSNRATEVSSCPA